MTKVWRELSGHLREFGLMEQSSNSEEDILTNPKTQSIIESRIVPVRENPGEMSAL